MPTTTTILFTSDTHVDVSNPAPIARLRKAEFTSVFKQIIDIAVERRVSAVCHAGDLFDTASPSPTQVMFVVGQLQRLGDHGIKFFYIRGNHEGAADLDNLPRGWAGEYVKMPAMAHVELVDPRFDEARGIKTPGYRDFTDTIRIYGVGYYRSDTLDVIKKYIKIEKIDQDKFNILLLHAYAETVNDSHPAARSEKVIGASEIAGLNLDLVALGHSHHQVVPVKSVNTTFFGPGSPVDWRFGQRGSHGVYIASIDDRARQVEFEFVPVETEYAMESLTVSGGKEQRDKAWFEKALQGQLDLTARSLQKRLVLSVSFEGSYAPKSARLEPLALRRFIQERLGDKLLFLGPVSVKDVNYEAKKVVDIQAIREIKMDEDRILGFLKASGIQDDLGKLLVDFYKRADAAYSNDDNLTGKKKELKKAPRDALASAIASGLEQHFAAGITDADLEKLQLGSITSAPARANAAAKQKKAAAKAPARKP